MKQTFLARLLQSRRLLKSVERLVRAQEAQTALLERLVVHIVGPETPAASPDDLRVFSGVTFSRDSEQGQILDFIARFHAASGREPTEEEMLEYLEGRPV